MSAAHDPFEYDDGDDPLADDLYDDEQDEATLLCPTCGADVHEDTQQCPYCGDWITPLAVAAGRRHWIWIAAAIAAAIALLAVTIL